MATDKSEPKVGLILKIGILAIAVLIGVRYGLNSYFHKMEDSVRSDRQSASRDERKKLLDENGMATEMDKRVQASMAMIAKAGERDLPGITPASSGPMARPCWIAGKCEDVPESAAADSGAAAVDAGASAPGVNDAVDAATLAATEAGAPATDAGAIGDAAAALDAGARLARDAGATVAPDAGAKRRHP